MVTKLAATVVSVHAGSNDDLSKEEQSSIQVELDGIVGDAHKGFSREAWAGDKQPKGTIRRNERQWSGVSIEELAQISSEMELSEDLSPTVVGANLCLQGMRELSRLPKGTLLKFPSGAELCVEEYNPPCRDMGEQIVTKYKTQSGVAMQPTDFPKAAKLTRGVVGVVEVAGVINAGDEVIIEIYETPSWLLRTPD